jgi:hypothetical protein
LNVNKEKANNIGRSNMIVSLHLVKVSSWILEKKGIFKEEEIQTIQIDLPRKNRD